MLAKDSLTKLSAVLGVTVDEFEAKLKSEKEEALEVPALYKDADLETIKKNRFEEGKKAAEEIRVKELRGKLGITTEHKTFDELLTSYGDKVKADVLKDPSEREKDLEGKLKSVQDKYKADEASWNQRTASFEALLFQEKATGQLLSLIPNNTIIPRTDVLTIFRSEYEIGSDNGVIVVKKAGQVLKNKLEEPLKLDDVMRGFLDERKFIQAGDGGQGGDGGAGGGNPKITTMSGYMQYCEKNNIAPMSTEGIELLNKAKKEPGFNINA